MKTVAFVGNPNVGKSALINLLADSDLKVGNWSGVTTERIEAHYIDQGQTYCCVDLPGLFGFNGQSDEERITQTFIEQEPIDCLVNVVDSSSLLNNLYCTLQCRQMQIPMVLVLNFDDEREANGIVIDTQWIVHRLGIPLIQMSAFDQKQAKPLKALIAQQCQQNVSYHPLLDTMTDRLFVDFCNHHHYHLKEGIVAFEKQYPQRMIDNRAAAVKSFERAISSTDPKQLVLTKKMDHWLLHPVLGYPLLVIVFVLLCTVIFEGSKPLVALIEEIMYEIERIVSLGLAQTPLLVQQLVLDGFLNALKTVFSFLPLLGLLHGMMALLEESGYMARIALLADRAMRCFHLSGKAMISLVLGFGCNVPAIASCSALENEKMRRKTALLVPFMSCGARLPIYFFFIDAFFPKHQILVLFILYGLGILVACFLSLLLDRNQKEEIRYFDPQMIELPCYRIPRLSVVVRKVKKECWNFLKKTFQLVLWVLLLLWFLMNVPGNNPENSLLAQLAKIISPLFIPLGFGRHWQLVASLFPSFVAKEAVVAFLLLLSPDLSFIQADSQLIALSFMIFCLCSVPCVMTCSMLVSKYGWKHCLTSIGLMLLVPYLLSFVVYQLFSLI